MRMNKEDDWDIEVIEKEVKEDVERKVEERTKQLEEEGKSKEEACKLSVLLNDG